jgi:hypothetical protein
MSHTKYIVLCGVSHLVIKILSEVLFEYRQSALQKGAKKTLTKGRLMVQKRTLKSALITHIKLYLRSV